MTIAGPPPGTNGDGANGSEQPSSDAADLPPTAAVTALPGVAYAAFAGALKDALRDFHSADLLARNPLLRDGICNLGESAGPLELKALLAETVSKLFGNARDEKLRRVIELTYFQPAPKQEVVADRLSLSFGTYRRHLATGRERLARWLWESSRGAPIQLELLSSAAPTAKGEMPRGEMPRGEMPRTEMPWDEASNSPEVGAPSSPRLSIVVLPFVNISGCAQDDPFVDGITETLTTDLSRCSGVFAISRSTAFA